MKKLVEFPVKDGSNATVLVEVDEPETGGRVRAARPGEAFERAQKAIGDSLDKVWPAVEQITDKLRNMSGLPDEFEVEFGIKLSAAAGAFLASAGTEANFNVRVMWHKGTKQNNP